MELCQVANAKDNIVCAKDNLVCTKARLSENFRVLGLCIVLKQ
jgi:hypothetical protein